MKENLHDCIEQEISMSQIATEITKKRVLVNSGVLMCVLGIVFFYYEYYLRVAPSVLRVE